MHNRLLAILFLVIVTVSTVSLAQEPCYPDTCLDPTQDTFLSYQSCCDDGNCCARLRYYVIPVAFVGFAFFFGAFFALCFQCR